MNLYGKEFDNMSMAEKIAGINEYRNLNGWFDKIWEVTDFRGPHREALLQGAAVIIRTDDCWCRYQFTQHGDLLAFKVTKDKSQCFIIRRLSGEKVRDMCAEHDAL